MTRIPSTAASRPRRSWQSLLRLPLLRRSLSRSKSMPADRCVGGVARWTWHTGRDGRCDAGAGRATLARPHRWRSTSSRGQGHPLLGATALGLETELRRVDAGHGGSVRALDAELVRLRDAQADLGKQQAGLESRLAAAIELAAVKGGAFDLVEEVRALRLVPAALLLREAAESGRPFAPALDQFAAAVAQVDSAYLEADPPVMEQIASLQPYAETGVLSWRDLRRSFASLAGLIDRADPLGWWDWALVVAGWRDDPLAPLHEAQACLDGRRPRGRHRVAGRVSRRSRAGDRRMAGAGTGAAGRGRLGGGPVSDRTRCGRAPAGFGIDAGVEQRRGTGDPQIIRAVSLARGANEHQCAVAAPITARASVPAGDSHCARASIRCHALVAAYGSGRPLWRNCT